MVQLQPGESIARSGPVRWIAAQGPERNGTLSVTNHALVFEGPMPWGAPGGRGPMMRPRPPMGRPGGFGMRGGMGPGPMPPGVLRIPLWRCRGAAVLPGSGGPLLRVDLLQRQLTFAVEAPDQWVAAIEQARAQAPPPPAALPGGPGRASLPRCEYCSLLSASGSTHCEHCGAPF